MGVVTSLGKETVHLSVDLMDTHKIQKEVVMELADLIADVTENKVEAATLEKALAQKIRQKVTDGREQLVKEQIFKNIYGYGILQSFVEDSGITDIDAIHYDYILVKRYGQYEKVDAYFQTEEEFERYCRLIIIKNGGVINEVKPYARVSDPVHKLRLNVTLPPRNANGASLTIRKQSDLYFSMEQLIEHGMLDQASSDILCKAVTEKRNILISGKGAAGKTTLLRSILQQSDEMERIMICESDPEILIQKKNCILQRLNKENKQEDLRRLIADGLTMSLDTYCIGEITGAEAWAWIKAGCTDHRTLATIHASSAEQTINRLKMLALEHEYIPSNLLDDAIFNSIDLIVYLREFHVEEVMELKENGDIHWIYRRSHGSHNYYS